MTVPSKVIHVRNLPENYEEAELRFYCESFGNVNRFLFLSKKQQALVEFASIEEAERMLESLRMFPVRLQNRFCFPQLVASFVRLIIS